MLELLRRWVMGLTGAAVFCAVATELCPRGPVKGVLRTLCAAVMTAALLSPLLGTELPAFPLHLAEYRLRAEEAVRQGQDAARQRDRRIIEERLAAYIWDKARQLGTPMEAVRLTLRWSAEGFWYPESAELDGPYSQALSEYITAELGVGPAEQTWRNDEGS